MDNALKAISSTDDELRVANHIVLFGGRDLEGIATPRKNQDGSVGEYFTADTELESRHTKAGRLPVDWEHGAAPEGDDVGFLGYVDWSTAEKRADGVWVERVLQRHNSYVTLLEQLIEAGVIGTSSEADGAQVEKAADGRITRWPLVADTLTVSPMEPRMLSANALQAAKALGLLAEEPEPEGEAEDAVSVAEPVKATTDVINETSTTEEDTDMAENEAVTMTPDELKALVSQAVDDGVKAYEARLPKDTGGFPVTDDKLESQHDNREDKPWKSVGEFLYTVAHEQSDPRLRPLKSKDAADEGGYNFTAVVGPDRVGTLHKAREKAITGMSEQVPADGGFLVGTDRSATLMERVYNIGELLRRVQIVPISGNSNGLTVPGIDETSRATGSRQGGVRFYWASEADEKTASKPKFRQIDLKLKKAIGLVYATDELLQDAGALEAWIMSRLPDELRFGVEDSIINGTGAGMPLGVLNSPALISVTKEVGQAADTIVAENVIKMWARRFGAAGRNYVWLHNQDTEPQLDMMSLGVGTGGQLVYMPPGGLSGSGYGSIKGRPVVPTEYNPTLGDVGDLLLFDPSEYLMIEKGGVQSASSIHVHFVYDESVFRFVWRVDGQPLWHDDLTPFKGTDTQSPYVAIAERA
jgi:HK97 family phage major capsid protein